MRQSVWMAPPPAHCHARTITRSAAHPTWSNAISHRVARLSRFERLSELLHDLCVTPLVGQFHNSRIGRVDGGRRGGIIVWAHTHVRLPAALQKIRNAAAAGTRTEVPNTADETPISKANRLPRARSGLQIHPFRFCGGCFFLAEIGRQLEVKIPAERL